MGDLVGSNGFEQEKGADRDEEGRGWEPLLLLLLGVGFLL